MTFPKTVGFQNTGEVIAEVVIIKGTTGGLFIYNGNPQLGNPPILAAVPPGVHFDPFGNPVNSVLNIGNFSAAHAGFDQYGDFFLVDGLDNHRMIMATGGAPFNQPGMAVNDPCIIFYNEFGAITLVVDPQAGGTFQYQDNNSGVQGPLIGAQIGKNTTDPVTSQTLTGGINVLDPVFGDTLSIIGANINWALPSFTKSANDTINQGSGATSPFRHIGAPEQSQTGHAVMRLYGTSVDGTVPAGVIISTTDPPVRAGASLLELQGGAILLNLATSPASVAGNTQLWSDSFTQLHTDRPFQTDQHIEIKNQAAPGAGGSGAKFYSTTGYAQVQSGQTGIGGDALSYDVGRLTKVATGTTINAVTAVNIAGLSKTLGIGKYHAHGKIWYKGNQAGGVPVLGFTFGGTITDISASGEYTAMNIGATSPIPYYNNSTVENPTGTHTGPTLTNGGFVEYEFDMMFTTSAGGTLQAAGSTSVAADTYTIQADSYMEIFPVLAT